MPYCRKCGSQLDEQAKFCSRCGTSTDLQAPRYERTVRYSPFPITVVAVVVIVLVLGIAFIPQFLGQWSPLGRIVGSGHVVTQNRPFSDFSSVSVSSGFEFVIEQSNSFNVTTVTDDNIQSYIQVSKLGDTLSVGLKPGYGVTTLTLRVEISMPSLGRLELSGGSHGSATGFISTNNFQLDASGGSRVQMLGRAGDLKVSASGGSQMNLFNFAVRDANVELSGGSQAEVNISGRLDANLSGGSRLTYSGNPTLGNINVSGGSAISRK